MPVNENDIEYVWGKAATIHLKNPNKFRRDAEDNEIYKAAYGTNGEKGWQVDHIKPKSKGGSDAQSNLQALQTAANQKKADKIK